MVAETIAAFGGGVFVGVVAWKIIAANMQVKRKAHVISEIEAMVGKLNNDYGTDRVVGIPGVGETTAKLLPEAYLSKCADIGIAVREI